MSGRNYFAGKMEEMIHRLAEFVEIPTVYDKKEKDAPFGKEIKKGLDYLEKLGRDMGFNTVNHQNYALEIQAGDPDARQKNTLGIVCHMDVVPAGNGWKTDPFHMEIKDGKMYGRGTVDDKGPLIASLYAMKYLKEYQKIPKDKKIIMIVGTDEEENFQGIKYFGERNEFPAFSFIPDGNFPLIYGEKGMLDFDLSCSFKRDEKAAAKVLRLVGGIGRNMVPDHAECLMECIETEKEKLLEKAKRAAQMQEDHSYKITLQERRLKVECMGKSAHAMSPEKGKSAVAGLFSCLKNMGKAVDMHEFISKYFYSIGEDCTGNKLGVAMEDTDSGILTFNVGKVQLSDQFCAHCNIRYPMTAQPEKTVEIIQKALEERGFEVQITEHLKPVNFSKDEEHLKKLLLAYRKITGDTQTQPITIGGATYTRFVPNSVAFGPVYADQEELAHEPNEFLEIRQFLELAEIYSEALECLMKEEK